MDIHSVLPKALDTMYFVAVEHGFDGRRAEPYLRRGLEIARILAEEHGLGDLVSVRAAVLCETVADVGTSRERIEEQFGADVAALVFEVLATVDDRSMAPCSGESELDVLTREERCARWVERIRAQRFPS